MGYDTSVISAVSVTNGVDNVDASHINNLYTEVIAIENELLNTGLEVTHGGTGIQSLTTGSILIANATNSVSELVAGSEGQVLKMGASVPAWGEDTTINKNYLIDSNFQVAQVNPIPGTEITSPATAVYPVFDMWKSVFDEDSGTNPTIKHSQEFIDDSGASYTDVPNSKFCYRINTDGAGTSLGASSYYLLSQYIESGTSNLAGGGNTITVSFYARSSITNKKLGLDIVQNYGTGGSPSSEAAVPGDAPITLTSTWTKYTKSFALTTLSGKTLGTNNDDYLVLRFFLEWGSGLAGLVGDTVAEDFVGAGDLEITQVKLELGSSATNYVPLTFEEELRRCQRYYWKSFPYKTAVAQNCGTIVGGISYVAATSGVAYYSFTNYFPTNMRIAPTITFYNPSAANGKFRNINASTDSGTPGIPFSNQGENGFCVYNQQVAGDSVLNTISVHATADARF